MTFILETIKIADGIKEQFDEYYRYLQSVKTIIPFSTFEFAMANWHYNPSAHNCPHDSWLETFIINEQPSLEHPEDRDIEIQLHLLGAYQDGHIELIYKKVKSYCLSLPAKITMPPFKAGHGDWLIDEIRLSNQKLVLHEIVFSTGSNWIIECEDIIYKWMPC